MISLCRNEEEMMKWREETLTHLSEYLTVRPLQNDYDVSEIVMITMVISVDEVDNMRDVDNCLSNHLFFVSFHIHLSFYLIRPFHLGIISI